MRVAETNELLAGRHGTPGDSLLIVVDRRGGRRLSVLPWDFGATG